MLYSKKLLTMKKIKILIALLVILLISCKPIFLNMKNTNAYFDNDIYNVGDDIVLHCLGSFDEDVGIGDIRLDFEVYYLENGERNEIDKPSISIIDNGGILESDVEDWRFSGYIQKDEVLKDFDKIIIFNINSPGTYQIDISINGWTEKYYMGGLNILITKSPSQNSS